LLILARLALGIQGEDAIHISISNLGQFVLFGEEEITWYCKLELGQF